ncbi:MAG: SCO family protein [Proteobacteria bacterium]|nr:SCO family protein [Pseudomonadota bacterium]
MKKNKYFISFLIIFLTINLSYASKQSYKRTIERYEIPDVYVVDQNNRKISLKKLLNSDKVIIVDFIYATCTTICPVLSAGFSSFQNKLDSEELRKVHLISFTIDPDHDSPDIMSAYLKRYKAKPGWDFFTGNKNDIFKIIKAFNVDIQDKMSHPPLILMKSPKKDEWVRLYGLMSTKEMIDEYYKIAR